MQQLTRHRMTPDRDPQITLGIRWNPRPALVTEESAADQIQQISSSGALNMFV